MAANMDITRIAKKSTRPSVPKRAYLCPHCGGWHVTSQTHKLDIKIAELNKVIENKDAEIDTLKKQLKLAVQKQSLKENVIVKTDQRIIELNKRIKSQSDQLKKLRLENSDTISKLITLQNKFNSNGNQRNTTPTP